MTLQVVGHRIMLEPVDIQRKTDWDFVLDVGDDWKREKAATIKGRIVGIGETAWMGFADNRPWAKLGDVVYFAKYSGKFIKHQGVEYVIINDEDVQCIVEEEE